MKTILTPRFIIMFLVLATTTMSIISCGGSGSTDATASVLDSRANNVKLRRSDIFEHFQDIFPYGEVRDIESFTINNETYLIIGNLGSQIFKLSEKE